MENPRQGRAGGKERESLPLWLEVEVKPAEELRLPCQALRQR